MAPDPLRCIVPMFGGGTRYVETLDAILEFVEDHNPTTDEKEQALRVQVSCNWHSALQHE